MNRHKRVSVSSNCSASVLTGRWRAISTAHASNRSVNPLPGLAHGAGTVLPRTQTTHHKQRKAQKYGADEQWESAQSGAK